MQPYGYVQATIDTVPSSVYVTVGCPSVCLSRAAGLLLSARWTGDIDR